jgi:hypothetical protein
VPLFRDFLRVKALAQSLQTHPLVPIWIFPGVTLLKPELFVGKRANGLLVNAGDEAGKGATPGGEPLWCVPQGPRPFFPVRGRPRYRVKQAAPANCPARCFVSWSVKIVHLAPRDEPRVWAIPGSRLFNTIRGGTPAGNESRAWVFVRTKAAPLQAFSRLHAFTAIPAISAFSGVPNVSLRSNQPWSCETPLG